MDTRIYRPDIDGLRAIAVLIVFLFHLDVGLFSGGYVGVDVFFVISGFLITGLIRTEIATSGRFSYSNFYIRRIRRLFPALFVTLLVVSVFGFLLFSPMHLQRLANAQISALLSVSNIFFWSESGYFDIETAIKPLLHTWSLSVEEQFYLFWPIMMVGIFRIKRFALFPYIIMALGFVSLFLNWLFIHEIVVLEFDSSPNLTAWFADYRASIFFLAPFRVFEFCLGASLVWIRREPNGNSLFSELMLLVGLLLIFFSAFLFTADTLFPAFNALLPCTGAVIVIYFGRARYLGTLLRNKVSVAVGLISYSLYLVHWPLIVFYSHYTNESLNATEKFLILMAGLSLATLMYFFVEIPFRKRGAKSRQWSQKSVFITTLSLIISVCFTSWVVSLQGGWDWRMFTKPSPTDQGWGLSWSRPLHDDLTERLMEYGGGYKSEMYATSKEKKGKILIVGDSHAGRLYGFGLYIASKYDYDVYFHWQPCWIPLKDEKQGSFKDPDKPTSCDRGERYWTIVKEAGFDKIFLSARWSYYLEGPEYGGTKRERNYFFSGNKKLTNRNQAYKYFENLVETNTDFLLDVTRSVIYLSQPPPPLKSLRYCDQVPKYLFSESDLAKRCGAPPVKDALARVRGHELVFERKSRRDGVTALISSKVFCPNEARCITYEKGRPLFDDDNHISFFGSLFLAQGLEESLDQVFDAQ